MKRTRPAVITFCLLAALISFSARASESDTSLTSVERHELEDRISGFYRVPMSPSEMDRRPPKFGIREGAFITPNPGLKLERNPSLNADAGLGQDILLQYAQAKGTKKFNDYYCHRFLKKKFPKIHCPGEQITDAGVEEGDRVSDLLETWLGRDETVYDLDGIPVSGKAPATYWSGDYWRMRWGLTSYRYSSGVHYKDYHTAIESYSQPAEWKALPADLDPEKLTAALLAWSPAEKYDLTVGDETFALTNEQKAEGEDFIGPNGKIEDWYGLCDGWAPAAILTPAANHPVTATAVNGAKVLWYPDDVRAMVSLAWSNGDYDANFVGERCYSEKPKRYPNGRLSEQECFDSNPATVHLALGNLLGKIGQPFVMDAAYDAEVWNQPIISYEFTYFNPLDSDERGPDWRQFAVDYDDTFKAADRFQHPLTRGRRKARGRYDDSGIKKIVGVIATVVYLDENDASFSETPAANETVRVTYTYDLELSERNGKLNATGGEWHANAHPDFLWVPQRGSVARLFYDDKDLDFSLDTEPSSELTRTARRASRADAYPLCKVVKTLLSASSGTDTYQCEGARN